MAPSKTEAPDPGVFLVKGDNVSVLPFSISINEQGEYQTDPIVLHTGIDMTMFWLDIAYKNLLNTETIHKKLMIAKTDKNDERIGSNLKKESVAGMQTIMAASIAIDAYYANVKEFVNIPKSTIDAWREKGTARYKQITEVLRVGFCLNQTASKNLRDILKQNFKFRDQAVHPESGTTAPLLHVELNKVTDWRYATFRFYNAKAIYGLSLSIIYKTANTLAPNTPEKLKEYCGSIVPRLKPFVTKWKKRYGDLL